jgi:hypothetical protein
MKPLSPQTNRIIVEHLESLRDMPARDAQSAERGRAAFLSQAQTIAQAVSPRPKKRLGYWSVFSNTLFRRKERFSMFTTLATIFTVIALALGGTGATVYAAQGSLPGESLYQLKLQSEDFRLTWENQEMEKIALALQFANRRMEEFQALLAENQIPPDSLMLRLQNQLDTALRLTAGLDDEQVVPALLQIRQTLEQQERILAQLQEQAGAPVEAVLLRLRDQIRLRISWVEEGQADPAQLRTRFGPGAPAVVPPSLTHTPGSGYGPGPGTGLGPQATCTCTPQSGIGPQPTSEPGNGFGPGPQPTEAPQDGTGTGPGPQPTSEPGNGFGPGPQPTEAPQDGTGTGPQPTSEPPENPGSQPSDPGNGPGSGNQP